MTTYPASYCPDCGTELDARHVEGRERRYCRRCERFVFHNAVPTAGVAVVDGDRVLLVERAAPPGVGEWTVPGGHLEADEPPREGAVRELREEAGVRADPDDLVLLEASLLDSTGEKYCVSVGYAVPRTATKGGPAPGSDASAARFLDAGVVDDPEVTLRPHARRRVPMAVDAVGD